MLLDVGSGTVDRMPDRERGREGLVAAGRERIYFDHDEELDDDEIERVLAQETIESTSYSDSLEEMW